jgi:RHS repeat-associated protein
MSVNGQAVQWDDNGNMLADGQAVYTYNTANKLVGVTKGASSIVYAYSGLGDRLRQIADGVTTDYTLDINTGLTQVLQDNTNKYIYGNQRIAQIAETQTGYFLHDALGSMRQMTDSSADLTLARTYDPYGNVVSSSGAGETMYGYTGEMQSGGLVHLRARDYASQLGRFTSRDTWEGDEEKSLTLNKWIYGLGNPIRYTDPSGLSALGPDCSENPETGLRYCQLINFGGAVIDVQHFANSRDIADRIQQELLASIQNPGCLNGGISYNLYGEKVCKFGISSIISGIAPYAHVYTISASKDIVPFGELFNGIALGIFMHYQYGLENFEGLATILYANGKIPRLCTEGHCSAFSNEDLPTDYLGFISSTIGKGWSINDIATKFNGGVGISEMPKEIQGTWDDAIKCLLPFGCGETNAYNKCWNFKIPDPNKEGHFQYLSWPEDLKIKPIKKGRYWGVFL